MEEQSTPGGEKAPVRLTPGTQLVYAGQVGGTYSGQSGGGANVLCIPLDPQYSSYTPGVQGHSYMYGAEYEQPIGGTGNDDATCAVCYVSMRERVLINGSSQNQLSDILDQRISWLPYVSTQV